MLIAFPFLFPPPVAPVGTAVSRLHTFRFDESVPGRYFVHLADGTGAIYRADQTVVLRFDETFAAGPGPNYWIYLNTTPVGEEAAFRADIGRKKMPAMAPSRPRG